MRVVTSDTSRSARRWRKDSLRAVVVLVAMVSTGCALWSVATADDRPDVSRFELSTCAGCHATTRPTDPWDVMAVYPDFPEDALIKNPDNAGLAEGFGDLLPIESTMLEFNAWQSIIADSDKGRDKTCFTCHLQESKHADRAIFTGPALGNLHAWMDTPRGEVLSNTLGLWVDADTYKTMVVATVKILNFGGGHRVPTGSDGRNIALIVRGTDAHGAPLDFVRGPMLPKQVGAPLAGTPGFLYARLFADHKGAVGVPIDRATRVAVDSRLQGGEHDELHFTFLLPETAPETGPAWNIEARLVWRSGLNGEVEEALMETASTQSE